MAPPAKAVPGMKTKKPQHRVASEEGDGNRGSSSVSQGSSIPMVNIPGSGSLTVQPQPSGGNGGGTANWTNGSSSQAPVAAVTNGSQTQTSPISPQAPAAVLINPSRGSQPANTGSQTQTTSQAAAAANSPSGSESQPTAEGTDRDKELRKFFEREWWACVSMSCFFIFWDLLILPAILDHSNSNDTGETTDSKSEPKLSKSVRSAVHTIAIIAAILGFWSIYFAYSLLTNPLSLLHRKTPMFFMMWSGLLSIVTLMVVMFAWKT